MKEEMNKYKEQFKALSLAGCHSHSEDYFIQKIYHFQSAFQTLNYFSVKIRVCHDHSIQGAYHRGHM